MKNYLLGIDIGTSSCKVALFTTEGEVVAQGNGDYKVYYPNPGWAEQDPEDWWTAVCQVTKKLIADSQIDPKAIRGIGVDGQSWSAIAIDRDGKVLCRNPIWMDTRAQEICSEINERVGEEQLFEVCGNPLQPAYSLPKVLWYKEKLPDVYQQIDKILQCNSFIVYRLTGVVSQDLSQGYGHQCFDMKNGCWAPEICDLLGIDPDLLPEIYPCHQVVGTVTRSAAELTGLAEGIPVVAGGLDAACGALGAGVIHPGETQEQGGQAGGMSICIDHYMADPRLILSYHVVPDLWLLQGGTVGGGGVIRWFEKEFGAEERSIAATTGKNSFYEMDQEADQIPVGSDGLVFLPYMSGERSPIWDGQAEGVYYGVDYAKTRSHFIRASMEGVVFALKHNLDTAEHAGAEVDVLRSMGGAANSRVWTQMKADVTGKKIIVPSSDTATTLGAAILAGVGTGVYQSFEEAIERTVVTKRTHEPDLAKHQQYQKKLNWDGWIIEDQSRVRALPLKIFAFVLRGKRTKYNPNSSDIFIFI